MNGFTSPRFVGPGSCWNRARLLLRSRTKLTSAKHLERLVVFVSVRIIEFRLLAHRKRAVLFVSTTNDRWIELLVGPGWLPF